MTAGAFVANLKEVRLTGAKVSGIQTDDASFAQIKADWVDGGPDGDGSQRLTGEQIAAALLGIALLVDTPEGTLRIESDAENVEIELVDDDRLAEPLAYVLVRDRRHDLNRGQIRISSFPCGPTRRQTRIRVDHHRSNGRSALCSRHPEGRSRTDEGDEGMRNILPCDGRLLAPEPE